MEQEAVSEVENLAIELYGEFNKCKDKKTEKRIWNRCWIDAKERWRNVARFVINKLPKEKKNE